MDLTRPLRPAPMTSLRPWAGSRLGEGVGELWAAGPDSAVTLPDGGSCTLDELAASASAALVGSAGLAALGPRFPLLAKLIDPSEWLSLQVHPDDALARRLYGPGTLGKDECWVVLEATPGARLVVGPRAGLGSDGVHAAIAAGAMSFGDLAVHDAAAGDVLNVRAGTIHAIGPGTFIYELEQPSDLTFRISDWGRPATPGRHLHLDEARQAVDPALRAEVIGRRWRLDGGVLEERHLRLEVVGGDGSAARAPRHPAGRSPDVVTAVGAPVALSGDGWAQTLSPLETAVVPAAVAAYEISTAPGGRALVGSLPG